MPVYYKLFLGHNRPAWAGPVTIMDNVPGTLSTDPLKHGVNARRVMGVVVPITTKGRPTAPIAYSGQSTGKAYGTDKGHLMGLENGGPDVSENIAPQSSKWQQSGGWRQVEKDVCSLALEVMGWSSVAKPAELGTSPCPAMGLFFSVAPYPEVDHLGEPKAYIGNVTKVSLYQGQNGAWTYSPTRQLADTRMFVIEPGGATWK